MRRKFMVQAFQKRALVISFPNMDSVQLADGPETFTMDRGEFNDRINGAIKTPCDARWQSVIAWLGGSSVDTGDNAEIIRVAAAHDYFI
jgi:hypothetical protein